MNTISAITPKVSMSIFAMAPPKKATSSNLNPSATSGPIRTISEKLASYTSRGAMSPFSFVGIKVNRLV